MFAKVVASLIFNTPLLAIMGIIFLILIEFFSVIIPFYLIYKLAYPKKLSGRVFLPRGQAMQSR